MPALAKFQKHLLARIKSFIQLVAAKDYTFFRSRMLLCRCLFPIINTRMPHAHEYCITGGEWSYLFKRFSSIAFFSCLRSVDLRSRQEANRLQRSKGSDSIWIGSNQKLQNCYSQLICNVQPYEGASLTRLHVEWWTSGWVVDQRVSGGPACGRWQLELKIQ